MTTDDTTPAGTDPATHPATHPTLDDPAVTRPDVPLPPEPGSTSVSPYLPAAQPPAPAVAHDADRRSPRMRTLVLGLVLAAVSVTTLVQLLTSVNVDGGAVALAVIIAAGVLLVAGGVASAAREARSAHERL